MTKKTSIKPPIKYWQVWHCGQCVYENNDVRLAQSYRANLPGSILKPVR